MDELELYQLEGQEVAFHIPGFGRLVGKLTADDEGNFQILTSDHNGHVGFRAKEVKREDTNMGVGLTPRGKFHAAEKRKPENSSLAQKDFAQEKITRPKWAQPEKVKL